MRIVILTCDKYSDAWVPFFTLFHRFWPDCPYRIDVVTDKELSTDESTGLLRVFGWPRDPSPIERIQYIGGDWNTGLLNYLNKHINRHGNEPLLVLLEDYFLTSTPNLALIEQALTLLKLGEPGYGPPGCVRLYPCPGGDIDFGNPYYSRIAPHADYRISLQAAVWNPYFMRQIAQLTHDPWDFERNGTKHSRKINRTLYAFKREVTPWPIEYICTAIVRGKWQQSALDYCAAQGVEVDTSRREIEAK